MDIDTTKCVGCGNCHIICTMGAISLATDGRFVVNQDECVECSICYRVLKNEEYWVWFVRAIRRNGLLQPRPENDRGGASAAENAEAGGPNDGQMLRVRRLQPRPGPRRF